MGIIIMIIVGLLARAILPGGKPANRLDRLVRRRDHRGCSWSA